MASRGPDPPGGRRDSLNSVEKEQKKMAKAVLKRGGSMQSLLSARSNRSQKSGNSNSSRLASQKYQIGAGIIACVLLSWIATISVLLMLVALRYTGTVVDMARQRYIVAAAERVGYQSAEVFEAAHAARQALGYAVQRQLYFEPSDYNALSLTLEPVFAARERLRAVDITFDTRNVSMTVRRVVGEGVRQPLLVQSDSPDCFEKLGRFGCVDGAPAREMPWYQIGLNLPGGQEADNSSDSGDSPSSFEWAPGPGFVPDESGALIQSSAVVAWSPAHSLIFRSVFPGTGGNLSIIARAVVEVTDLREDGRLDDTANLGLRGSVGAVYICDFAGTLLATLLPGEQARVSSPLGGIQFRMAWEQGGWAASLTPEQFEEAGRGGRTSFKAEGNIHVAIIAMRGSSISNFFVVVASERAAYTDASMELICNVAQGIVVSPYLAAGCILALCFVLYQINQRRKRRRVQPEERLAQAEKSLAMLRSRTNSRGFSR